MSDANNDHSNAVTDGTVSTVSFVAGGALLTTGIILFATGGQHGSPDGKSRTGITVSPTFGPGNGGASRHILMQRMDGTRSVRALSFVVLVVGVGLLATACTSILGVTDISAGAAGQCSAGVAECTNEDGGGYTTVAIVPTAGAACAVEIDSSATFTLNSDDTVTGPDGTTGTWSGSFDTSFTVCFTEEGESDCTTCTPNLGNTGGSGDATLLDSAVSDGGGDCTGSVNCAFTGAAGEGTLVASLQVDDQGYCEVTAGGTTFVLQTDSGMSVYTSPDDTYYGTWSLSGGECVIEGATDLTCQRP